MRIKTSELEGAALDFCVAKSLGKDVENRLLYVPSINWLFCGQYIERFRIALIPKEGGLWGASVLGEDCNPLAISFGDTPLVAICRVVITYMLGDEVDVPEEVARYEGYVR